MRSKLSENRLPFFVYGTLLPGQPNAYLWGDCVTKVESASLGGGCLYDLGSYPMLVEEAAGQVAGVVNHVAESEYEAVLARLDHLEGYDSTQPSEFGYRRVRREVQGENGRSLPAWVYIGSQEIVRGMLPIAGGDWAVYTANTFKDIEQWWQDVSAVHGLPEE